MDEGAGSDSTSASRERDLRSYSHSQRQLGHAQLGVGSIAETAGTKEMEEERDEESEMGSITIANYQFEEGRFEIAKHGDSMSQSVPVAMPPHSGGQGSLMGPWQTPVVSGGVSAMFGGSPAGKTGLL